MVSSDRQIVINEPVIEKTCWHYPNTAPTDPHPPLTSPLKGEEDVDFPPLQGEG